MCIDGRTSVFPVKFIFLQAQASACVKRAHWTEGTRRLEFAATAEELPRKARSFRAKSRKWHTFLALNLRPELFYDPADRETCLPVCRIVRVYLEVFLASISL